MYDLPLNTNENSEAKYECLKCGKIVETEGHPGECPDCKGGMVGRAVSLE